jgi:hypothetical protein
MGAGAGGVAGGAAGMASQGLGLNQMKNRVLMSAQQGLKPGAVGSATSGVLNPIASTARLPPPPMPIPHTSPGVMNPIG